MEKNKKQDSASELNEKIGNQSQYPERSCWIYLSEKYNEILFVPIGIITEWTFRELDKVIVREWPLKISELQKCVNLTLDNFEKKSPHLCGG